MRKSAMNRPTLFVLLLALAGALLSAPPAGALASKTVVKKASNATLGKMVLTNNNGRTLYTLSTEKNGKIVCKAACLTVWPPLTVPAKVKPAGPVTLGTVKRPDGRTQVTWKGRPLYTYSGDSKKGDANGEGIKGMGTWHAATVAGSSGSGEPPAPYMPPENPYGY
jgi:predicted lipoprotein with Yx(FWY)xxD motif